MPESNTKSKPGTKCCSSKPGTKCCSKQSSVMDKLSSPKKAKTPDKDLVVASTQMSESNTGHSITSEKTSTATEKTSTATEKSSIATAKSSTITEKASTEKSTKPEEDLLNAAILKIKELKEKQKTSVVPTRKCREKGSESKKSDDQNSCSISCENLAAATPEPSRKEHVDDVKKQSKDSKVEDKKDSARLKVTAKSESKEKVVEPTVKKSDSAS